MNTQYWCRRKTRACINESLEFLKKKNDEVSVKMFDLQISKLNLTETGLFLSPKKSFVQKSCFTYKVRIKLKYLK